MHHDVPKVYHRETEPFFIPMLGRWVDLSYLYLGYCGKHYVTFYLTDGYFIAIYEDVETIYPVLLLATIEKLGKKDNLYINSRIAELIGLPTSEEYKTGRTGEHYNLRDKDQNDYLGKVVSGKGSVTYSVNYIEEAEWYFNSFSRKHFGTVVEYYNNITYYIDTDNNCCIHDTRRDDWRQARSNLFNEMLGVLPSDWVDYYRENANSLLELENLKYIRAPFDWIAGLTNLTGIVQGEKVDGLGSVLPDWGCQKTYIHEESGNVSLVSEDGRTLWQHHYSDL